jgi:hypothetical protein
MKRGRPTRLNAELTTQICRLLGEGISITAACDALGIAESRYFEWREKDEQFREQATRARANGKIALVRQVMADKDWRAKAWYLERCWPNEFGKVQERPLPPLKPERQGPRVCFILSLPDGTQRKTSLREVQKMVGQFPIEDTCEPPAQKWKSFPAPNADGDASLDELGSD